MNRILQTLDYPARILDNIVHKAVDNITRMGEREGYSRESQQNFVNSLAFPLGAGYCAYGVGNLVNDVFNDPQYTELSEAETTGRGANMIIPVIYGGFMASMKSPEMVEGTTNDSLRTHRPYALIFTIACVYFGADLPAWPMEPVGIITLPRVLSMYIGDDNTTGVLDSISDAVISAIDAVKPIREKVRF